MCKSRRWWCIASSAISISCLSGCGGSRSPADSAYGLGENGYTLTRLANFPREYIGVQAFAYDGKGTVYASVENGGRSSDYGELLAYSKSSGLKTALVYNTTNNVNPSYLFVDNTGTVHLVAATSYATTFERYDGAGGLVAEGDASTLISHGAVTDGLGNYYYGQNQTTYNNDGSVKSYGSVIQFSATTSSVSVGDFTPSIGSTGSVLAADVQGNVYGITVYTGSGTHGNLFLYNKSTGLNAIAPLPQDLWNVSAVEDGFGNLYVAASAGDFYGPGVLYRYTPNDGLISVATFAGNASPYASRTAITSDRRGNIYGSWSQEGKYGNGYLFKFNPTSGVTVLADFNNAVTDATFLAYDAQGTLYGASGSGGENGAGCIFDVPVN